MSTWCEHCKAIYCHSWHDSSYRSCYAGVFTCLYTHWGPGRVRWSTTCLQIPNGSSTHLGPHTHIHTHIHTDCPHIIFHVSGHLIAEMWYHNMTRWSRIFSTRWHHRTTVLYGNLLYVCVCVCVCVSACVCVYFHAHTFHTCQHTKATWEAIESRSSCGICYSNGVWLFACVYHSTNTCVCTRYHLCL